MDRLLPMNCLQADSNQDLNQVFEQGQHVLCITNAQMSSTGKLLSPKGEALLAAGCCIAGRMNEKRKILEVCLHALPGPVSNY
jgi:hypothetical protein